MVIEVLRELLLKISFVDDLARGVAVFAVSRVFFWDQKKSRFGRRKLCKCGLELGFRVRRLCNARCRWSLAPNLDLAEGQWSLRLRSRHQTSVVVRVSKTRSRGFHTKGVVLCRPFVFPLLVHFKAYAWSSPETCFFCRTREAFPELLLKTELHPCNKIRPGMLTVSVMFPL